MCFKDCLMIGIMMADGGTPLRFSATKKKKKGTENQLNAPPSVPLLPVKAIQPSSRQSELYHVRRFVARGKDVRHHVSPAEQPFHAPA